MRLAEDQQQHLEALWAALAIEAQHIRQRGLPIYPQARRLSPVGLGTDHRDKLLTPGAAAAWQAMQSAAAAEGVTLTVVSAFRSYDYQALLIRQKLERGRALDDILSVNAPPGCSEHHTGRALDVGTPDCPPVDASFETTDAFAWLSGNAPRFGFALSYPRNNRYGYIYEPWHWRHGSAR